VLVNEATLNRIAEAVDVITYDSISPLVLLFADELNTNLAPPLAPQLFYFKFK
jgi:hypothetical protein